MPCYAAVKDLLTCRSRIQPYKNIEFNIFEFKYLIVICCEVSTHTNTALLFFPVLLISVRVSLSSKRSKLDSVKGWLKHGLHAGEGEETKLNYFQAGGYFISHRTDEVQSRARWNLVFGEVWAPPRCQRPGQPRILERQLDRAAGNAGMLHRGQILPARHSGGLTATGFEGDPDLAEIDHL